MDLGTQGQSCDDHRRSKGLGRAMTKAFGEEGVKLSLCARAEADLKSAEKEFKQLGFEVLAHSEVSVTNSRSRSKRRTIGCQPLPAHTAGFRDRGVLCEGTAADIVIYDLDARDIEPDWVGEIVQDQPGGEWRRCSVRRATVVPKQRRKKGRQWITPIWKSESRGSRISRRSSNSRRGIARRATIVTIRKNLPACSPPTAFGRAKEWGRNRGDQPVGGHVQRDAPVDADHVRARLAHGAEQFAGADAEVDAWHARVGDAAEHLGRVRQHELAVVPLGERAGPGVEQLHGVHARIDLNPRGGESHVGEPVGQGVPGVRFAVHQGLGPFVVAARPSLHQIGGDGERRTREADQRGVTQFADKQTHIPISRFFIASPGTSVGAIKCSAGRGKDLILTPGVYSLAAPIQVTRPDTVVLGLGFATLVPQNGTAAMQVTGAAPGAKLSGMIFNAGPRTLPRCCG